jgi:hypothetical protein
LSDIKPKEVDNLLFILAMLCALMNLLLAWFLILQSGGGGPGVSLWSPFSSTGELKYMRQGEGASKVHIHDDPRMHITSWPVLSCSWQTKVKAKDFTVCLANDPMHAWHFEVDFASVLILAYYNRKKGENS